MSGAWEPWACATAQRYPSARGAIVFAAALFQYDFTIMKSTKISRWEGATFRIGLQFFNFFNHPNFGFPITGLGPPMGLIAYLQRAP
jgi:hypothetical protein